MIREFAGSGYNLIASSSIGLSGALGGWAILGNAEQLTTFGVAVVTLVSCAFGILSSATRRDESRKVILMNSGAIWIASFYFAKNFGTSVEGAAIAGLAVGLAGVPILILLEKLVVYLFRLVMLSNKLYSANLSPDETEKLMGKRRQAAQTLMSAIRIAKQEDAQVRKPPEDVRLEQWIDTDN